MISDKDVNIIYFSKLLITEEVFSNTFISISNILKSFNLGEPKLLPKTKDIWVRDFMPIQVSENKFIEFRYDPDYLQGTVKGYRDLKTYPDIVCDAIGFKTIKSDIILDGGNVIKSNNCVILTDKIVKENRLCYSKTELINKLSELFEVEKIVLIPWDKKEKYGHADGMLRFIDNNTVLINEIYKNDKVLDYQLKQNGIKREYLQFDIKKNDTRSWAYINFLQTKDIIILPKFNIKEDNQALEQIEKYYNNYDKIIQVDMTEVLKKGGALNCISWTIKQ